MERKHVQKNMQGMSAVDARIVHRWRWRTAERSPEAPEASAVRRQWRRWAPRKARRQQQQPHASRAAQASQRASSQLIGSSELFYFLFGTMLHLGRPAFAGASAADTNPSGEHAAPLQVGSGQHAALRRPRRRLVCHRSGYQASLPQGRRARASAHAIAATENENARPRLPTRASVGCTLAPRPARSSR